MFLRLSRYRCRSARPYLFSSAPKPVAQPPTTRHMPSGFLAPRIWCAMGLQWPIQSTSRRAVISSWLRRTSRPLVLVWGSLLWWACLGMSSSGPSACTTFLLTLDWAGIVLPKPADYAASFTYYTDASLQCKEGCSSRQRLVVRGWRKMTRLIELKSGLARCAHFRARPLWKTSALLKVVSSQRVPLARRNRSFIPARSFLHERASGQCIQQWLHSLGAVCILSSFLAVLVLRYVHFYVMQRRHTKFQETLINIVDFFLMKSDQALVRLLGVQRRMALQ